MSADGPQPVDLALKETSRVTKGEIQGDAPATPTGEDQEELIVRGR